MKASNTDRGKVLLLAGTGEARKLAEAVTQRLPEITLISSLAGVTKKPAPIAGMIRRGGFGGAEGLHDFLLAESVNAVIDATHPFADTISRNAVTACRTVDCPLLRFERAAWKERPGDNWRHAPSLEAAATSMERYDGRVLLTVGSKDLSAFRDVSGPTLFARMTEPPEKDALPTQCEVILDRGPFDLVHEQTLLSRLKIDLLVTKNSGGDAVSAKLDAARELGITVLMIDRPAEAGADIVTSSIADSVAWVKEKVEGSLK